VRRVPTGSTPTTHIVKPAIDGLDDHDLNEHLCLTVARRVGLRAAFTEVRDFDGERAPGCASLRPCSIE
jgi:serine/threonine-protein kinase HipA